LAASVLAGAWLVRRARSYPLQGRNALITGGSRGLGLEIARVLVAKGASVAIVARDESELARAAQSLRAVPGGTQVRIVEHACDLRDPTAIATMLSDVRERLGPIDVLVNNAGAIQVGPLAAMTVEDFEAVMKLHCFAPLHLMLALRGEMRARGGGRVANIASIGGVVAVPHLLPYSASKFALMGLSQGMRTELAADRILVSTIAPGLMRTGSPRRASFKGKHRQEYAWFAIADSLPLLSMSSDRAARRIVRAIERGEPRVVLGLPAKLAALGSVLCAGVVTRALTLVNGLLPGGSDPREYLGFESESRLAPSLLTALSERAATRNNQR
jgi:short-subunit dehydrogenase